MMIALIREDCLPLDNCETFQQGVPYSARYVTVRLESNEGSLELPVEDVEIIEAGKPKREKRFQRRLHNANKLQLTIFG